MTQPLAGLAVVDAATDRAGSIAGMLLADLGATVTRVFTSDRGARPHPTELPDAVCWDRGKSAVEVSSLDPGDDVALADLLAAADVLLVDGSPVEFDESPLPDALTGHFGRLVTVWAPPHGAVGDQYRELPHDPLLQAAITAFALNQPAIDPTAAIAPVVNIIDAIQGSLAASAAVAGALEASRSGVGQLATVSGVDAAGALLATLINETLDVEKLYSSTRNPRLGPFFRPYVCADGEMLFLATLIESLFIAALGVLDAVEIMVMEGVDGVFFNLVRPDVGPAAAAMLEERFASQPRDYWLEKLAEAGVPAEPVLTRAEWLASGQFAATGGLRTFEHPIVGQVTTPPHPATLQVTGSTVDPATCWPSVGDRGSSGRGPLAGLRVVDLSMFLAGPFGPSLMAFWGADVVKVEPAPEGDTYRPYGVSYLAVNQVKRSVKLDFTTPEGRATFERLVADADVLIDNLRPSARDHLGLGADALAALNPALVHGNVTAFGPGPFVERPGFDPCVQALSGLMWATGTDDEPLNTTTPVHDVAAGASLALGVLAAVYQRSQSGVVSSVVTSLAAGSSLLQCAELTDFAGRPPAARGSIDFVGPDAAHRFYRTSDGWIGVAAAVPADDAEGALAALTSQDALAMLSDAGVPAAIAVGADWTSDPYLAENVQSHIVVDPTFGRCRVMRGPGSWSRSGVTTVERMVAQGADTEAVATAGWSALQ